VAQACFYQAMRGLDGKSTVVREFCHKAKELAVVAPTNVAALNIGGTSAGLDGLWLTKAIILRNLIIAPRVAMFLGYES
jgi:hypothetical protein